jgi:hypothetical protein
MTTLKFHVRGLIAMAVFVSAFLFVPIVGVSFFAVLLVAVRA